MAFAYYGTAAGLRGTRVLAERTSQPPTIDGNFGDWEPAAGFTLDRSSAEAISGVSPAPQDSAATVRARWDTQNLYLAIHVADDVIVNDSSDFWRDDEIELAFYAVYDGNPAGGDTHQYTINADGRVTDLGQPNPPIQAIALPVAGGWNVEVRIPASHLYGNSTPLAGDTALAFNIGLHDDDDGGNWDSFLVWQGSSTIGGEGFGTMRLIGSGAPLPPTSTPTATPTSTRTATPTATCGRGLERGGAHPCQSPVRKQHALGWRHRPVLQHRPARRRRRRQLGQLSRLAGQQHDRRRGFRHDASDRPRRSPAAYVNADSHANIHTQRHADCDADHHTRGHADFNADSHRHSHEDAYAHADRDGNRHGDDAPHADTHGAAGAVAPLPAADLCSSSCTCRAVGSSSCQQHGPVFEINLTAAEEGAPPCVQAQLDECAPCAIFQLPHPPGGGVTKYRRLSRTRNTMDADQKRQVLNRLKSIEGHVRGIQRMVEDDTYCIDVIRQVHAVQKALENVNALVLGNHLNTCVTTAIRGEDAAERERMIGEIVGVFQETGKL